MVAIGFGEALKAMSYCSPITKHELLVIRRAERVALGSGVAGHLGEEHRSAPQTTILLQALSTRLGNKGHVVGEPTTATYRVVVRRGVRVAPRSFLEHGTSLASAERAGPKDNRAIPTKDARVVEGLVKTQLAPTRHPYTRRCPNQADRRSQNFQTAA